MQHQTAVNLWRGSGHAYLRGQNSQKHYELVVKQMGSLNEMDIEVLEAQPAARHLPSLLRNDKRRNQRSWQRKRQRNLSSYFF